MKVRFDFTLDELVDVIERSLTRSKSVGTWRLQGFAMAFLAGGLFGYLLSSNADSYRLIVALTTGVIAGSIHLLTQTSSRKRRMMKLCQEKYGAGPFTCEIEITEAALTIKQMDTQIIRDWKTVRGVEESGEFVEIILNDTLILVRDRAFQSPDERQQFVTLTRQYAEPSRHSHAQKAPL